MHFVIMGCGRVGAMLAASLEGRGHDVAVIDQDPLAFRRLGRGFSGRKVKGIGFDREVLRQAGIRDAYAFAAVSSGDNSNILAARVARETFEVERVVARIYDSARAEIYQRLGIPTVASVRWAADQALQQILPEGAIPEFLDPSGRLAMAAVNVHEGWIGRRVLSLERYTGARVAFISRLGEGLLPTADTVYQAGDSVHFLTGRGELPVLETRLDQPPSVE